MIETIVKIQFNLEPDEDGYPPIGSESLNATPTADGHFIIENTPFFAEEVALHDKVSATPVPGVQNRYTYASVIEESGYKALSIIFLGDGHVPREQVCNKMREMGCCWELGDHGQLRMLAVAVPAQADYTALSSYLDILLEDGMLSYAELAL